MEAPKSERLTVITDLQIGDRFIYPYDQQPYIKCDYILKLNEHCSIQYGVGLYTGKMKPFFDHEVLQRTN